MSRPNLMSVLNELLGAERDLWLAWGQATVAGTQGTLTAESRDRYNALREDLFSREQIVYDILRRLADPIGLADRIPVPTRLPELTAAVASTGVATAGLGVAQVPIILWVAAVIVAIAEIAALAYVVTRLAEIGADLVTDVYQIHRQSANYKLQLQDANARFNACLRAGRSPADCAAAAPTPAPPALALRSHEDRVWEIFAIGGVIAGLGTLAWYGYKYGGKR